jgi:hypothetical protein
MKCGKPTRMEVIVEPGPGLKQRACIGDILVHAQDSFKFDTKLIINVKKDMQRTCRIYNTENCLIRKLAQSMPVH